MTRRPETSDSLRWLSSGAADTADYTGNPFHQPYDPPPRAVGPPELGRKDPVPARPETVPDRLPPLPKPTEDPDQKAWPRIGAQRDKTRVDVGYEIDHFRPRWEKVDVLVELDYEATELPFPG